MAGSNQIVPVICRVTVPGRTVQTPVSGSCTVEAAGTVIAAGTVRNRPVAVS